MANDLCGATPNPITVVIITHTMAYGGIDTLLINWVKHIDCQRFNVHLLCFSNNGGTEQPFVQAARRAGLEVNTDLAWSRRKPIFQAAWQFRRYLKAVGAEVVHAHNTYAQIVAWLATRGTSIKLMATVYVWANLGWKQNVLQFIEKRLLPRFDLLTAQSIKTLEISLTLGFPPEKTKLLLSGFDTGFPRLSAEERRRRRLAMGIADDVLVCVNVARFYPEKAQDKLLEGFARFAAQWPKAELWIMGCGPMEEELQAYSTQLGLDGRVRWLGFVEDLMPSLQLADMMVHPSHAEGVPLAVCSGMALAMPVVASDVGGVKEVLKHGENGILVPAASDPAFLDQFVDAMATLAGNPAERERLGLAATRFIEKDYSIAAATRQLEDYYLALARP